MNLRFSLFSLVCLTSFAALACAALARPDPGWLSLIVTGVVIVFVVQLLRAILQTDRARAAAIGWLLFASAYLAVTIGPWLDQNIGPNLLSSRGLAYVQSRAKQNQVVLLDQMTSEVMWSTGGMVSYDIPVPVDGTSLWVTDINGQVMVGSSNATAVARWFHLTGHWLLALVAGNVGAMLGGWLEQRCTRRSPASSATAPAASTTIGPTATIAPG